MFKLPQLPYSYDALEPYIDAKTMEIHYTKHHQAYVNNLNDAVKDHPALQKKSLHDLITMADTLPAELAKKIKDNAGGHFNHSFFWPIMKKNGGGQPKGKVAQLIKQKFGSFEKCQEDFNAAAKKVFGSGWAWLAIDKEGKLVGVSTPNQDAILIAGLQPIFGLDVWEHAYYLKYQNRRPDYINAWWNVINWNQVEENYRSIIE
jgi:Fe-Mn family superoxide dismutase